MVKAQEHTATFPYHKSATLPETGSLEKKHEIRKGALFNLLSTDILHVIYMWIVVLEHRVNLNSVMERLNISCNTVLSVDSNHSWGHTTSKRGIYILAFFLSIFRM